MLVQMRPGMIDLFLEMRGAMIMIYQIPSEHVKDPLQPAGDIGIPAERLPDGEIVNIPVSALNILVTGTTRYGKTTFTKKIYT